MKKKLIIGDGVDELEADRIVKTSDSIIGYIDGSSEPAWAFRGVKDWSRFKLDDGQEWDLDEKVAEYNYLLNLDYRLALLELGVN